MSYLNAEALGEPRRARMTQLADQALAHIDQWFVKKSSRQPKGSDVPEATGQYYIQPFMVGLTTQALIQYWERDQGFARPAGGQGGPRCDLEPRLGGCRRGVLVRQLDPQSRRWPFPPSPAPPI
jgi:hypothetical protein